MHDIDSRFDRGKPGTFYTWVISVIVGNGCGACVCSDLLLGCCSRTYCDGENEGTEEEKRMSEMKVHFWRGDLLFKK